MLKPYFSWLAALVVVLGLSGCGYNTLQAQDEAADAAWAEVVNQYQRRADLIPNLANTVKGYVKHEEQVLVAVTEARARVGSINMTAADATDEAKLKAYAQAQSELGSAIGRLLVVTENYPQLKADQNFRDLQAQLEGTENRIALARNRYIEAVRIYNTGVRQFPQNLTAKLFGMSVRPNFTVENEAQIQQAPKVEF